MIWSCKIGMIEEFHCVHISCCEPDVEDLKVGCKYIDFFFQITFSRKKQRKTEHRLKLGSFLNMQLVITLSEMKNCR